MLYISLPNGLLRVAHSPEETKMKYTPSQLNPMLTHHPIYGGTLGTISPEFEKQYKAVETILRQCVTCTDGVDLIATLPGVDCVMKYSQETPLITSRLKITARIEKDTSRGSVLLFDIPCSKVSKVKEVIAETIESRTNAGASRDEIREEVELIAAEFFAIFVAHGNMLNNPFDVIVKIKDDTMSVSAGKGNFNIINTVFNIPTRDEVAEEEVSGDSVVKATLLEFGTYKKAEEALFSRANVTVKVTTPLINHPLCEKSLSIFNDDGALAAVVHQPSFALTKNKIICDFNMYMGKKAHLVEFIRDSLYGTIGAFLSLYMTKDVTSEDVTAYMVEHVDLSNRAVISIRLPDREAFHLEIPKGHRDVLAFYGPNFASIFKSLKGA